MPSPTQDYDAEPTGYDNAQYLSSKPSSIRSSSSRWISQPTSSARVSVPLAIPSFVPGGPILPQAPVSPTTSTNITCSDATNQFSQQISNCLVPFYATRPDTVPAGDMLARAAVSCLCGSPFAHHSPFYLQLTKSNCTLPDYLDPTSFGTLDRACHQNKWSVDSHAIVQTLNLTIYLRNGKTHTPLTPLLSAATRAMNALGWLVLLTF